MLSGTLHDGSWVHGAPNLQMIYSFLTIVLFIFFPACGSKTDLECDVMTDAEGESDAPEAFCPTEIIYASPGRL